MYGSRRLIALALLALSACKSKEAPKAAEPAKSAAALAPKTDVLDVPRDLVYAASSHVRVVDVGLGQVVAGIDLSRAVKWIEFDKNGQRAFVAASDGVHEIDVEKSALIARLTENPARHVLLSPDGKKLFVLENSIKISDDQKTRNAEPFHLLTIDLDSKKIEKNELVGERIFRAIPASAPGRYHLAVTESGRVRMGRDPEPFGSGVDLDASGGLPGALGVRHFVVTSEDLTKAYVPIEGEPSQILEVELVGGQSRFMSLGAAIRLRGMALAPGGRLVIEGSTELIVLELATGHVASSVALEGNHTGIAIAPDGKRAYLARTIDGTGGAITIVALDPMRVQGKIHLEDITPWAIAVRPRASLASR
ncbi:MAG: hypothetical protein HYV07_32380 [Deltaproteobacteria bacterium]|nr:hypothetical protein [Deltaproteobacteria bacterium]